MDDTRLQQVSQPVLRDAGIKVKLLENVSQNTIDAARTGSVRQVLVSLLSERPMGCSYHGLKAYMTRLAKAVPQFSIPSSKGDLERILKSIADYKPPGVYRLKDTLHTASMPQMDPKNSHTSANTVEENCRDNERTQNAGQGGPPSVPFSKDFRDERNGSVSRAYPLSSSSRGSEDTEEGWILHHINREPERLPTIVTREDYDLALEEYTRLYEAYFRLHQLLSANRRDFEALQHDLEHATSEEEKRRIEEEICSLWVRRVERSKRWESAFRRLHNEVAEWKVQLEGYNKINTGLE